MGERRFKKLRKPLKNRLKENDLFRETLRTSNSHKLKRKRKLESLESNVTINKDNILQILMTTDDSELETRRYELTSKMVEYYGYPTEY